MSRLEHIFESTLYCLTPAIIIEIIRSCFNKNTGCVEKFENEHTNDSMQDEQLKKEPYLITLKIVMIFFGCLSVIGIIGIFGFGVDSKEILTLVRLSVMLFIACGFFYIDAPKTRAEAEARERARILKREEQRMRERPLQWKDSVHIGQSTDEKCSGIDTDYVQKNETEADERTKERLAQQEEQCMRERPLQLKGSVNSEQEISEQDIESYTRKAKIFMGQIFRFWKWTTRVSKVLIFLWLLLAIGTDSEGLNRFEHASIWGMLLLTPVMIIECLRYGLKRDFGNENPLKALKTYKGVYLTGEQIYQIENKISLPIVHTSMYLEYDEVAVYHSVATRQEMKKKVVGRTGGYWGGTIRVTKRFSIHTGSSSGTPVYEEVPVSYEGDLIITNKRLVFWSAQKGFSFLHHEVCNATPNASGFWFITGKGIYTLSVPKAELALNVLSAVRNGTIPIEGWEVENQEAIQVGNDICKEESNDTFQENINEIEKNDISSIDGMNGHEFEYFCADILRKNGFSEVNVTKGSGDQGVDILAVKDGVKYAIQCKNYASALSNTPVQEVNAGKTFYNCHVGVVMTNSTFTQGAEALAQATGVLLWNREVLQKMMEASE